MNDILLRSLTGAAFVGLIIGGLYFGEYTTVGVLSLFIVLGLSEFYRLFRNSKTVSPDEKIGMVGGISILFVLIYMRWEFLDAKYIVLLLPLTFLALIPELFRKSKSPLSNVAVTVFGWVYVILPLFLVMALKDVEAKEGQWLIPVGMFTIIWSNDTFAYLTGRMIGKNKLFERISPKKTWEGTVGGIVFAMFAGYLFSELTNMSLVFWIPAAFLAAFGAIFGDLFESMIKRSLGIKDSGNILPGHGGILDRFDATLFAAPLFYTWYIICI
ncbi:phosphatidate cytidylyltransferase [Lishizhenia tianjinensis]|uniref:Phosphatidate cytidylyltransferase n=1 Tax=Lishizhenia tianjinensis TaxID=477690 RepID=A0A1I6YNK3_9FLAO|nr:CDP-archaeol synthase [Lishizhenia tianjinensis]SFT51838.1 phosphatidate cytidylyltransferase [Lishizhenia tianjinensis]